MEANQGIFLMFWLESQSWLQSFLKSASLLTLKPPGHISGPDMGCPAPPECFSAMFLLLKILNLDAVLGIFAAQAISKSLHACTSERK